MIRVTAYTPEASSAATTIAPRCRTIRAGSRITRRASAEARAALAPTLDLRYGPGPKETLDLFLPAGDARAERSCSCTADTGARSTRATSRSSRRRSSRADTRSRSSTTTCARTCRSARSSTSAGARWRGLSARAPRTARIAERVVVGGHSAGGHLVAMLYAADWAAHGFARGTLRWAACRCRACTTSRRWCSSRSTSISSSTSARRHGSRRCISRRGRARRSCSRPAPTRPPNSCGRRGSCGTRGPRTARPACSGPLLIRDRNHFDVVVDFARCRQRTDAGHARALLARAAGAHAGQLPGGR